MYKEGFAYYKIKLHNLTEAQKLRVIELSNVRRAVYNIGLEYCNSLYENNHKARIPSYNKFCKWLTKLRSNPKYSWLKNYNLCISRYALKDLRAAFDNFFNGICRHPSFKSKRRDQVRFATRDDRLKFRNPDGRFAFIPGLSTSSNDLIDCGNHNIPFGKGIKYNNARIKFDGVDYWLSLSVKIYKPFTVDDTTKLYTPSEPLGIDVGIRKSAVLSDGTVFKRPNRQKIINLQHKRNKLTSIIMKANNARRLEAIRTRTKYENIPVSKKYKQKLHKLYKTLHRITNIYKSHYHKISKEIANRYPEFVVIETLNTQKMKATSNGFGEDIYDSRLPMLLEYITYKCEDRGIPVIKAHKGFKSSKLCSCCGNEYNVGRSEVYACPYCGNIIDRDLNAAINLRNYGIYN